MDLFQKPQANIPMRKVPKTGRFCCRLRPRRQMVSENYAWAFCHFSQWLLMPESVSTLIVTFRDHNNPNGAAQEVWINPRTGVEARSKSDGTVEYVARLSQFLPEAITTNTPIKSMSKYLPLLAELIAILDCGGRIYRPGNSSEASRIDLGSIDAILSDKPPKAFQFTKIDEIKLNAVTSEPGVFSCDVYLDDRTGNKVWLQPSFDNYCTARTRSGLELPTQAMSLSGTLQLSRHLIN
jgi:hypothetical protein